MNLYNYSNAFSLALFFILFYYFFYFYYSLIWTKGTLSWSRSGRVFADFLKIQITAPFIHCNIVSLIHCSQNKIMNNIQHTSLRPFLIVEENKNVFQAFVSFMGCGYWLLCGLVYEGSILSFTISLRTEGLNFIVMLVKWSINSQRNQTDDVFTHTIRRSRKRSFPRLTWMCKIYSYRLAFGLRLRLEDKF